MERLTREIADVSNLAYVARLKVLELFFMIDQLLRGNLITCWNTFHFEGNIGPSDGFIVAVDQRTRVHSIKVVVPR